MDLDALRKDLKYWDDWSGDDWPLGNLSNVLAAARAVLDSEEAYRCRTHKAESSHAQGRCTYSVMKLMQEVPEDVGRCAIEPVLVVRVRLLAEEKL